MQVENHRASNMQVLEKNSKRVGWEGVSAHTDDITGVRRRAPHTHFGLWRGERGRGAGSVFGLTKEPILLTSERQRGRIPGFGALPSTQRVPRQRLPVQFRKDKHQAANKRATVGPDAEDGGQVTAKKTFHFKPEKSQSRREKRFSLSLDQTDFKLCRDESSLKTWQTFKNVKL